MTLADLLVAVLLKPAAVVGIAVVVTAAMRRTSAAARHVVWCSAIGTALILPLLTFALPAIRVEAPPWLWSGERITHAGGTEAPVGTRDIRVSEGGPRLSDSRGVVAVPRAQSPRSPGSGATLTVVVWLLVAAALTARRIAAERRVQGCARDAVPAGSRTQLIAARAARKQQLPAAPGVRVTDRISSPAVTGIRRPVVLLPRGAERWADVDLDRVLVHEFGHVARWDCLLNFCADVVAAITWYNPLVQHAVRRMRLEAEQACDESVLRTGVDAEAYAHLLLRIARASQGAGRMEGFATALARVTQLEERLIAVLQGKVRHSPLSPAIGSLLVTVSVALTIPVSAFTLVAAEVPAASHEVPELREFGDAPQLLPEPDLMGDSLASPQSERVAGATVIRPGSIAEALRGPDSALVRVLAGGLKRIPEHEGDLVSARAAWALSQVQDGRLVEPLIEKLEADDWRIQSYAAWALAPARDRRSIPYLISMLDHSVWRARAMAAYALRESGDSSAIAAMTEALVDRAWQVRVEAVEYLAAVGGAEVEPLLRSRLSDRHVAVRLAVRRALPQL